MRFLRPYLIVFGIFLLLTACGNEEKPMDILSEEEMVPVIADMQVGYSGIDKTIRDPKLHGEKYEEMNQLVLKKNNIDREKFYRSYDYYKMRPEIMDTIFQRVIGVLTTEMNAIQSGNQGTPRPKPSLAFPKQK